MALILSGMGAGKGTLEDLGVEVGKYILYRNAGGATNPTIGDLTSGWTATAEAGAMVANLGKKFATAAQSNASLGALWINEDGSTVTNINYDGTPFDISNVVLAIFPTNTNTNATFTFTPKS